MSSLLNETQNHPKRVKMDFLARFKADATRDMTPDIDLAFSGDIGLVGVLSEISDVSRIRLTLMFSGHYRPEEDILLKAALTRQIEIYQEFCQIWTQENPDPERLFQINEQQAESTQRWQVFVSAFNRFKDVTSALTYAFEEYPYPKRLFQNKKARAAWVKMLVAEQRAFCQDKSQSKRDLNALYETFPGFRMQAVHAALLDVLFDENEHATSELLRAIGIYSVMKTKRDYLTRRISELNQTLSDYFGAPPSTRKRWIEIRSRGLYASYQLLSPI